MYIALKTFKVKNADGSYRIVQPGEPVPEAKDWKQLKAYLERRWLCVKGEETARPGRRHFSVRVQAEGPRRAPARSPEPVSAPEPASKPAPAPETASERYSEPETGSPLESQETAPDRDLSKLRKSELQEVASELGIDTDQTKAELLAAILEAQA